MGGAGAVAGAAGLSWFISDQTSAATQPITVHPSSKKGRVIQLADYRR